jgi:uncharacterized protein DUF3710
VIFRRRKGNHVRPPGEVEDEPAVEDDEEPLSYREQAGPWDADEREYDPEDPSTVDLGGLVITGRPDLELRLQTDQVTGAVGAAMLVSNDGAVELRAFAASRAGGAWDDIRREIAAEASNRGGTATESDGPYGTELRLKVPVKTPEGRNATQASRIVGIEGPRWLLRATYLGRAADEPDPDDPLESAVRDVVVVRGGVAMAPRDPIPLQMPHGATPEAAEEDDSAGETDEI